MVHKTAAEVIEREVMETQPGGIDTYKVQIAEAFDLFYGEGNSTIRLTEEQHLIAFLGA